MAPLLGTTSESASTTGCVLFTRGPAVTSADWEGKYFIGSSAMTLVAFEVRPTVPRRPAATPKPYNTPPKPKTRPAPRHGVASTHLLLELPLGTPPCLGLQRLVTISLEKLPHQLPNVNHVCARQPKRQPARSNLSGASMCINSHPVQSGGVCPRHAQRQVESPSRATHVLLQAAAYVLSKSLPTLGPSIHGVAGAPGCSCRPPAPHKSARARRRRARCGT